MSLQGKTVEKGTQKNDKQINKYEEENGAECGKFGVENFSS